MKKKLEVRVFTLSPEVHTDSAGNFLIEYARVETPTGPACLAKSGGRVVNLLLTTDRARVVAQLEREWKGSKVRESKEAIKEFAEELFTGTCQRVDLLLKGTPFQLEVWKALVKIPSGETVSYQDVADRIGQPSAVRAVANAIGANPVCLLVPCHRVIKSDGSLGGFGAGSARKQQILNAEDVRLN